MTNSQATAHESWLMGYASRPLGFSRSNLHSNDEYDDDFFDGISALVKRLKI